jgi:hypothetical protein
LRITAKLVLGSKPMSQKGNVTEGASAKNPSYPQDGSTTDSEFVKSEIIVDSYLFKGNAAYMTA